MEERILLALFGAIVASIGWIVTYVLQRKSKANEERRAFLRRQVEESYSSLARSGSTKAIRPAGP
jgi:hypothetical protein